METRRSIEYKFIETMTVADDTVTDIVNEWVGKGWHFEGIQFAMSSASKRPSMAFVTFTRQTEEKPDIDHAVDGE